MGFKIICQLEKEPLKGVANVQEIFSQTVSLVIDLQYRCEEHLYRLSYAIRIRIVRQVTGLLQSNLCENVVKQLI